MLFSEDSGSSRTGSTPVARTINFITFSTSRIYSFQLFKINLIIIQQLLIIFCSQKKHLIDFYQKDTFLFLCFVIFKIYLFLFSSSSILASIIIIK